MAREREEMGWSVTDDGAIHHGKVGDLPGTRITEEEKDALKAIRPKVAEAVRAEGTPVIQEAPAPVVDTITPELVAGLQQQVAELRSEFAAKLDEQRKAIEDVAAPMEAFTKALQQ